MERRQSPNLNAFEPPLEDPERCSVDVYWLRLGQILKDKLIDEISTKRACNPGQNMWCIRAQEVVVVVGFVIAVGATYGY